MVRRALPIGILVLAALAIPGLARAGANPVVHGLTLPRGSSEVSPGRFLAPYDMKRTVKFFKKLFSRENKWGGKRFRQVMNIPAAKVVHISNAIQKDAWSGVNLSEYRGRVHIYVLERHEYPDPKNVRPTDRPVEASPPAGGDSPPAK